MTSLMIRGVAITAGTQRFLSLAQPTQSARRSGEMLWRHEFEAEYQASDSHLPTVSSRANDARRVYCPSFTGDRSPRGRW